MISLYPRGGVTSSPKKSNQYGTKIHSNWGEVEAGAKRYGLLGSIWKALHNCRTLQFAG